MNTRADVLAVAFLVLLTLILLALSLASAATLTVTDCGDSADPYQLRALIAATAPGDTITVPACTITLTSAASPLTINKTALRPASRSAPLWTSYCA